MTALDLTVRFDAEAAWAALHESVRAAIGAAVMNLLAADTVIQDAADTDDQRLARVGFACERAAQIALDGVLAEISITALAPLLPSGQPRIPALLGMVCERCGCSQDDACPEGCGWAHDHLCTACTERPA